MAMNAYAKFLKVPGLEPNHQLKFSVILGKLVVVVGGVLEMQLQTTRLTCILVAIMHMHLDAGMSV